jgi:hypothetical protein
MGESILIKRSSSLAGASFGTIAVSYPSGSICTCTCGSTVITAPDTTGLVVFKVSSAGTWNVKSTNGTQTATKDIVIPNDGEKFNTAITLEYSFVLFSSNSPLPSKYTPDGYYAYWGNGTAYDEDNNKITIAESNTQREIVYFTPAIDCSKYSKITFTGKQTTAGSAASYIYLGVTNTIPISGEDLPNYAASTTFNSDYFLSEHSVELDISGINTSCYLVVCGFYLSEGEVTSVVFS